MDEEELYPCYDDDPDAHSCSAHLGEDGCCEICGDVVYGTVAYRDIYGGE